jgi:hypothetical protein
MQFALHLDTCRDAAKISQTAFTCFINVVLWERAPYVASLMDGDELVRRSGQVTERLDQAINSGRPLPKGYGQGPRSGQERHPRRVAALPDLPMSAEPSKAASHRPDRAPYFDPCQG